MNALLSARDLEVLYIRTDSCDDELYAALFAQLNPREQARAQRYLFLKDRLAFAIGRALVRRTLAGCGVPAPDLEFVLNAYGKPELSAGAMCPSFSFNISHSTGLVAAAFSIDRAIGVDLEFEERKNAGMDIARSFFAPDEVRFLESLPEEERRAAFFSFWTLKESYIKARGLGLAIPLKDFAFTLDPPRIHFSPRIEDAPENWCFWQRRLTPSHPMALAAHCRTGETLDMHLREVGPQSLC
jgi:4'-phosphopantetheinyl transferase